MFPFCFEWQWDIGHFLFFGGMWYALIIIGVGLKYCILKSAYETCNCCGGEDPACCGSNHSHN